MPHDAPRVESAGLALVSAVARLLNAGLGAEDTIQAIVRLMRDRLPAASVVLWVRHPEGRAFSAVAEPPSEDSVGVPRDLPPPAPGGTRVELVHDGERLGVLEAVLTAEDSERRFLLGVLGDLLAPYLAGVALSQDLASEVAFRTREAEEQRRFTSLVIDTLPIGLYVVDRDYRIQIWNRKRETGTQGLRREDVVGRPVFEVLTRQPADLLKAELDQVFETGQMSQMEIEVPTDDAVHFYRISKIPMRLDGEAVSHVITVGEDVTEWHGVQHQILQSEKLAAIGQLAAGIMHEINNPLATIGACVAAMEGRLDEVPGPVHATLKEYAEIIDHEVQRCTGIVDGLLDFTRPRKAGKAKHATDINDLVEHTLFLLKHHQRFKKLNVTRAFRPDLPQVMANPEQLIQVFMALMLNALDAMEHAGGTLTVRTDLGAKGDAVTIEFQDTGMGIAQSDLPKIFEPFYTTKAPGRGTGLGLSICYGIVEDHMGSLVAESLPGAGSIFRVVLPALLPGRNTAP